MKENRRRTHIIKARLSDNELKIFNHKVEKSKLSKEELIRSAILKLKVVEPPNLDYYQLKNELSRIGNNLNQLTRLAHSGTDLSKEELEKSLKELNSFIKKLDKQVRGDPHGNH
ncbi:MAG: plasmid mobilization relaxosome protein MobC [Absicoccus porci]|uniref:plasmid mobilization protein n=1 Tax=Absicoccus porci TaxID=2486576 RepID=UPI002E774878|nr:plasmid mobilization relaxosome protein MobC [Absicoccus porci]MEE1354440.1 plasmid mobilization relaxosome protein MobC [Absicoccus porci]